jgi:hypothetical protein
MKEIMIELLLRPYTWEVDGSRCYIIERITAVVYSPTSNDENNSEYKIHGITNQGGLDIKGRRLSPVEA